MRTLFYALRYTDYSYKGKNYWVKISVNENKTIYRLDFVKEKNSTQNVEEEIRKHRINGLKTLYLNPQEYKNFKERRVGFKN